MTYREVIYKGESLKVLNKRIEEIFRRNEVIISFEIKTIGGEKIE